jgi:hypothetical protein
MELKLRYYKNLFVELFVGEFLSFLFILILAFIGAYIGIFFTEAGTELFAGGGVIGFLIGLFVGSFGVSEIFNKVFSRMVSVEETGVNTFTLTIGEETFTYKKSEIDKVRFLPSRKLFSRFHKVKVYVGDRCFRFVCSRTVDLKVAREFVELLEKYKDESKD